MGTRDELRQALSDMIKQIRDHTGLSVEVIGASIWRPKSYRPWLSGERLDRLVRFRMDGLPGPTAIEWTAKKGAIGACWASNRDCHRSWKAISRRHQSDEGMSDAEWSAVGPKARANFSKAEFEAMCGKYAEVLAVPVQDVRGGFMGVISVDIPGDAVDPNGPDQLDSRKVKNTVRTAAYVVRSLLGGAA